MSLLVILVLVCFSFSEALSGVCKLRLGDRKILVKSERYFTGQLTDFKTFVNISWELVGYEDFEIDGFLAQLEIEETHLMPYNDCQASVTHAWVATKNHSVCDTGNATENQCDLVRQTDGSASCKCNKKTCPLFPKENCKGVDVRITKYRSTVSIPKERRSITYQIELGKIYQFMIGVYYRRHFFLFWHPVSFDEPCPEVLSRLFNLSIVDSTQKCCKMGQLQLRPTNFRHGEVIADHSSGTANVTFFWNFPLYDKRTLVLSLYADDWYIKNYAVTEPKAMQSKTSSDSSSDICEYDDTLYSATAYNLTYNKNFTLHIAISYSNYSLQQLCGRCYMGYKFNSDSENGRWNTISTTFSQGSPTSTPIYENEKQSSMVQISTIASDKFIADKRNEGSTVTYKHCVDVAKYSASQSNHTTCTCPAGMDGNGIKEKYNGTGCSGCPLVNQCHTLAACVTAGVNSTIYECRCLRFLYGDGLKSGSGCSSTAKWIVTIAVPLILVAVLMIAIIICCIFKKKNKPKFEQNTEVLL